jgi:uncharacterized protein involved in tolerance to divalent cations
MEIGSEVTGGHSDTKIVHKQSAKNKVLRKSSNYQLSSCLSHGKNIYSIFNNVVVSSLKYVQMIILIKTNINHFYHIGKFICSLSRYVNPNSVKIIQF